MSQKLDALNAKIEAQAEKLRKLKEQKAKAERRAKLIQQKQERTKDTRRKILLGAMLLEKIKRGEIDPDRIRNDLDPFYAETPTANFSDFPHSPKKPTITAHN